MSIDRPGRPRRKLASWHDFGKEVDSPAPAAQFTVETQMPAHTGILDADGRPIMKDPDSIGFVRFPR